ncbi:MAG: Unknown protein [uncultured Sulfurovum sp.]|uniref:Uncharacterized protein n=1 Tax=uncultured Sulfurovum sp. TaxID=269237 RepID=A0A6S6UFB4_9BACT|nr:MAG: Unknown protein [uncultured Sulfurovum sp.]
MLSVYIIINEEAFFYAKHITPTIGSSLPFDFTVDYYEANYHLRDKEGIYAIVFSGGTFPTGSPPPNKEKVNVISLNALYWTSDRLIISVSLEGGIKLIEIKGYVSDGYVSEYDFVTDQELLVMDDRVEFDSPPTIIKYWYLIGSLYLIILLSTMGRVIYSSKAVN